MHLLQDNDSGHNEPIYEEFIKDAQDDKEDEEGNKQDHLSIVTSHTKIIIPIYLCFC
jgi:hypothetical protein